MSSKDSITKAKARPRNVPSSTADETASLKTALALPLALSWAAQSSETASGDD